MTVLIQPATTNFQIGPTCGIIETTAKEGARKGASASAAGGRAGERKKSHRKFCRGPAFNFRSGVESKGKERKEGSATAATAEEKWVECRNRQREGETEEDNDSDAIKFALGSWSPPELILSL